jgi:type VI secretion system protein ImpB
MAKSSAQKFIARNRCPRVQIEYDVELYGSEKKVMLPFVVGVMGDLSGKPAEALPPVNDRKFLEIDVDNFESRLKASKPRVAFQVPNTLTGEGNLNVEMTFESMDDFSPAAVARKVDALNKLLQARTELENLLTYMDGKDKAEDLMSKLLKDPELMKSLAAAPAAPAAPAAGAT